MIWGPMNASSFSLCQNIGPEGYLTGSVQVLVSEASNLTFQLPNSAFELNSISIVVSKGKLITHSSVNNG